MAKSEIPGDVRRFVLARIPSVPHMEALMLLRATAPRAWSAPDLAQRLYVRPAVATGVLADLHEAGMLAQGPDATYCFAQPPGSLGEVIETLVAYYASHLVEITLLIHSTLDRKAQQFADAFDFRKEN